MTILHQQRMESAWAPWLRRFAVTRNRAESLSRWAEKEVYQVCGSLACAGVTEAGGLEGRSAAREGGADLPKL